MVTTKGRVINNAALIGKALQQMDRMVNRELGEKCTGCWIYEMVCSLYHEKEGINPKRSRIRVVISREKSAILPMVCHACTHPSCVESCPTGCLSQDNTGMIAVDGDSCTGCGACVDACPFAAMHLHPMTNIAMTCDRCDGKFLCISYCPESVLDWLMPDNSGL